MAGRGGARFGGVRRRRSREAWLGCSRQAEERNGNAGGARQGWAMHGEERQRRHGMARFGEAWRGHDTNRGARPG